MSKNEIRRSKADDPYNLGNIHDFLYEHYTVMSATECTGLMPSPPKTRAEKDSYKEIYDVN